MNFDTYKNKLKDNIEYQEALKELEVNFALANVILHTRLKKGLSQSELARKVGTRQANISRIEAGLGNPTLKVIKKIFQVLEISVFFSTEKIHVVDCVNDAINADSSETLVIREPTSNYIVSSTQVINNNSEMEMN